MNADLKTLMRNHLVGLNVLQKLFRSKSSMNDKMAAKVWMSRRNSVKDETTRTSWLNKQGDGDGALVTPVVEGRITILGLEETPS